MLSLSQCFYPKRGIGEWGLNLWQLDVQADALPLSNTLPHHLHINAKIQRKRLDVLCTMMISTSVESASGLFYFFPPPSFRSFYVQSTFHRRGNQRTVAGGVCAAMSEGTVHGREQLCVANCLCAPCTPTLRCLTSNQSTPPPPLLHSTQHTHISLCYQSNGSYLEEQDVPVCSSLFGDCTVISTGAGTLEFTDPTPTLYIIR